MRISVAVVTWNRSRALRAALDSVRRQTRQPDEVVVVDSASTDGTPDMLAAEYPEVRLVRLHRNMGCPEGRNIALANCTAEIIYSLDDDGVLHQDCLAEVERCMTAHPAAGVVASKTLTSLEVSDEVISAQMAKLPRQTGRFSGGAVAFRRSVLEAAGYYPADFWRQSEEADLALRAIETGFELWYQPSAIMLHPPGITDSGATLRFSALNSMRSILRLVPWRFLPAVLIRQASKYVVIGVRQGNVRGVLRGLAEGAVSTPWLLAKRRPVSIAAMREYLRLRRDYHQRIAASRVRAHAAAEPQGRAARRDR